MNRLAEQHDIEDCSCDDCADTITFEQDLGIRCIHGRFIPWTKDPRDKGRFSFITDIECGYCQIDHGPSVYAFDGTWQRILDREKQP